MIWRWDSGRPEEADDDIGILVLQIQLGMFLREMGKMEETDKPFELSWERIKTKHENNQGMDAALARLRLELPVWRYGKQGRTARFLRCALSARDATDLEKDVRAVAEQLHKYSLIRGTNILQEEAEGLLSCVLGINEDKARAGWLASQYGFNFMTTE